VDSSKYASYEIITTKITGDVQSEYGLNPISDGKYRVPGTFGCEATTTTTTTTPGCGLDEASCREHAKAMSKEWGGKGNYKLKGCYYNDRDKDRNKVWYGQIKGGDVQSEYDLNAPSADYQTRVPGTFGCESTTTTPTTTPRNLTGICDYSREKCRQMASTQGLEFEERKGLNTGSSDHTGCWIDPGGTFFGKVYPAKAYYNGYPRTARTTHQKDITDEYELDKVFYPKYRMPETFGCDITTTTLRTTTTTTLCMYAADIDCEKDSGVTIRHESVRESAVVELCQAHCGDRLCKTDQYGQNSCRLRKPETMFSINIVTGECKCCTTSGEHAYQAVDKPLISGFPECRLWTTKYDELKEKYDEEPDKGEESVYEKCCDCELAGTTTGSWLPTEISSVCDSGRGVNAYKWAGARPKSKYEQLCLQDTMYGTCSFGGCPATPKNGHDKTAYIHLDGHKDGDGVWRWGDGDEFTYTNWATNEPSSDADAKHLCMKSDYSSKGKWYACKESDKQNVACCIRTKNRQYNAVNGWCTTTTTTTAAALLQMFRKLGI